MSTNLQDITLQSMDETLVATNDEGHLIYPMLFLNRQPVPSDVQGWDRVLVFVDGNGVANVSPSVINLNEENNYFQSLTIQGEGAWSISGVVEEFIAGIVQQHCHVRADALHHDSTEPACLSGGRRQQRTN
jgi:hypothetical protein